MILIPDPFVLYIRIYTKLQLLYSNMCTYYAINSSRPEVELRFCLVFAVKNGFFIQKQGLVKVLTTLTNCFVQRVDAKSPVFGEGTLVPSFLIISVTIVWQNEDSTCELRDHNVKILKR